MAPQSVVASQHRPIFVEQARKWDFQSVILTGKAYGGLVNTYTSISKEHALEEFNADDWPPRPVIWQARLAPPLGSSQRLTGSMVHVILIIVTKYRMQSLQC